MAVRLRRREGYSLGRCPNDVHQGMLSTSRMSARRPPGGAPFGGDVHETPAPKADLAPDVVGTSVAGHVQTTDIPNTSANKKSLRRISTGRPHPQMSWKRVSQTRPKITNQYTTSAGTPSEVQWTPASGAGKDIHSADVQETSTTERCPLVGCLQDVRQGALAFRGRPPHDLL